MTITHCTMILKVKNSGSSYLCALYRQNTTALVIKVPRWNLMGCQPVTMIYVTVYHFPLC